jgi:hypothetical protein
MFYPVIEIYGLNFRWALSQILKWNSQSPGDGSLCDSPKGMGFTGDFNEIKIVKGKIIDVYILIETIL